VATPYELIKAKRDGRPLAADDIARFIADYTRGAVTDYQMSAMCMAVFFRGLAPDELSAWTEAMLHSGEVLDLSDVPGVKVDKHSTGGVGDKVSLCLAPLVAACGVPVPMISGRGLGHTGGTLDKLESIPGFRVDLSVADYRKMVREVGACLIGQTSTLAPADKKLYALRDVTATVDCLPLIASSIMSKKMAEGIDALVLDVKVGSGAFMKNLDDARALGQTMIAIGERLGRKVTALITDMDQPLGKAVGNALEVIEAVDVLMNRAPKDLTDLTLALGAQMLLLGRQAETEAEAHQKLEAAIADGSALTKLKEIVRWQGGDVSALDDPKKLPTAKERRPVPATAAGYVEAIDTEAIGQAALVLGAGRARSDQTIDPAVGLLLNKKLGDPVSPNEPLVEVHLNDPTRFDEVQRRIQAAYRIASRAPKPRPLIFETLGT
jgi:pyrimidine-nucleoside phosphorylase